MQSGIGVEGFAGVAKEDGVCAGGKVTEGVVDEVSCGGAEDVADRAEVVGQGPEDVGGGCIGEEFVLSLGCPKVMVGNGAVVDLDGSLVIFRNEDGFGIADYLADPDVVVVVGIFDNLDGFPRLGFSVKGLLGYLRQAVTVIPGVEFAVCGIGFADTVTFGIIRISVVSVEG